MGINQQAVKIEHVEYIKLQDTISSFLSLKSQSKSRRPPKNQKVFYRTSNSIFLYSNYKHVGLLHSNINSIYKNSHRVYHTSADRQIFKKSPDTSIKGAPYESKKEVQRTQYKQVETKHVEPLSPFRKEEQKQNLPSKIKSVKQKVSAHVSKLPEYGVSIGHKCIKISKALGYALMHPIETKNKTKAFLVKHVVKPYRLIKADVRLVRSVLAARKARPNKQFTAIEKRRLIAIFSDAVRFVPYIFFIVIPALELLLPLYLAIFPGAKPGWFMSQQDKSKKLQTKLEYRLEIAKFLKDTVELYGKRRDKKEGTNVSNLSKKIMSGNELSADDLLPYVDLFKSKHMSLDNWNKDSLRSICALLSFPAIINNAPDFMLKQSIEWRMATLRQEDEKFHKNGLADISDNDLSLANIVRGGRGYGLTRQKLERSLKLWSEMNYVHEFPIPLIFYTKAVYILPKIEPTITEELKVKKEQPKAITEEQKLAAKISEDRIKQDLNFQALDEISLSKSNLLDLEKSMDKVYQIVISMDNSATIEQLHKTTNTRSERTNKMSKILEKYSTKTESAAINLESNNEIYEY